MSTLSASKTGGLLVVYAIHEEELAVGDIFEPAAFLEASSVDSPYMTTGSDTPVWKIDWPFAPYAVMYRFGVLRAPMWDMLVLSDQLRAIEQVTSLILLRFTCVRYVGKRPNQNPRIQEYLPYISRYVPCFVEKAYSANDLLTSHHIN